MSDPAVQKRNQEPAAGTRATKMRVAEIMKNDVEVCAAEDNLGQAARRMWDCDIGCLPVVGVAGRVIGVAADRDGCMAALTRGQPQCRKRSCHALHAQP
jgi:predicted transcriptional regulator